MCISVDSIKFARRVLDDTVDRTTLCMEALELIGRIKKHERNDYERQVYEASKWW